MYWSGTRNRGIGGKMLKTLLVLFTLVFSLSAFACWKVEGSFSVDGETWKINNKFEHNKEYIMPAGNFIVKLTLKPEEKNMSKLTYVVHEKKGTTLSLVTEGEEEAIKEGETRDIYAKGKEGQPNSIITVKLTNI